MGAGNEIIQPGPQVREAFEKLQFGGCKQGGIPNPAGAGLSIIELFLVNH